MENAHVETGSSKCAPAARFGAFELHLVTGELRKHGVRLRLQSKPFQLLRALIEQPGHVVTRDELKERLWASDTFVDFESGLNTAVNRLRVALGDSADNPVYVETLSRLGYRFIAPVVISSSNSQRNGPAHLSRSETELSPKSPVQPIPSDVSVSVDHSSSGKPRFSSNKWIIFGFLTVLVLSGVGALIATLKSSALQPSFRQITFRNGSVGNARFTRDGRNVVFSAAWNGEPNQLFLTSASNPDPQPLGFRRARLVAVSESGEIGMLASGSDSRVPEFETVLLHGSVRRKVSDHIVGADWAPDSSLCIVRDEASLFSIEYPPGRKLYTAKTGWISDLRVYSKNKIAFAEHPIAEDDAGNVVLLNESGEARVLSSGWASLDGLAWSPSGREVWFTAASSGVDRALMAVDLNGHVREVAQAPGGLNLFDIAPSGQVLIARSTQRMVMMLRDVNPPSVRDISWLDWSRAAGITSDGSIVLFDETGSGGGKGYSAYLYRRRTASTQRIGTGRAMDLSPDGSWAVTQSSADPTKLFLISIRDGKTTPVATNGIAYHWARFFHRRDLPQILFEGNSPGKGSQIYRQQLPGGVPVQLNLPTACNAPVVNDTDRLAVSNCNRELTLFDLTSGALRAIRTGNYVYPVAFLNDNEILTSRHDSGSMVLESLNVETGRTSVYRRLEPDTDLGANDLFPLYMAKDSRTLIYSRMRNLSDLFVAIGLK